MSARGSAVQSAAAPSPNIPSGSRRNRRAIWLAAALLGGVAVALTCGDTTVPPGQNPITLGLCSFPRSCYLVRAEGPNAMQCDDAACSSQGSCRLSFTQSPTASVARIGEDGTWQRSATQAPNPKDPPAVCSSYPLRPEDKGLTAVCATPEMVCVARGVACPSSSYCVHRSSSGSPAEMCQSSVPVAPQHRPTGSGLMTYCPLVDDICCAPSPDGGVPDGGAFDGGVPDGGVPDGSVPDSGSRDATIG